MPVDFASLFSNAGNWINENPEKFAIAADMIGQRFDPNNPFAGIGTLFAQGSLMQKGYKEQQNQQQDFLSRIFGEEGQKSALDAPVGGNAFSLENLGLTPKNFDGLEDFKVSSNPDGSKKLTINATTGSKQPGNSTSLKPSELFSNPY